MGERTDAPVELYTDGSCLGNPGPGGWAVLLRFAEHEKSLSGGERATTNNRMEMMAAIAGLESLRRRCSVDLYTDSQYVIKGMTQWLDGWRKRGWKTAAKTSVKNADLWQRLYQVAHGHDVRWHWVKGHAGHRENEQVDALARAQAVRFGP